MERTPSRHGRENSTLTPRELQVLVLVAAGLETREVATALGMAAGTVGSHIQAMMRKLGCHNRAHLVAIAYQRGLLPR